MALMNACPISSITMEGIELTDSACVALGQSQRLADVSITIRETVSEDSLLALTHITNMMSLKLHCSASSAWSDRVLLAFVHQESIQPRPTSRLGICKRRRSASQRNSERANGMEKKKERGSEGKLKNIM
eukprot:TRINITY_DN1367_c0_g1_i1.p1 TRINITY_DN1367_c0_g1~~TRINITY_DN1367_c0_g1_i1.p1  ORF type:complete len:130 (-),score=14.74 TRINITY_DN1367_c0_g1_i1:68-457(-)